MNAIELLEQQHEETVELLKTLQESRPGNERKETFKQLQRALLAHMVIEEELFYPTVAAHASEGQPVAEGYEEHSGARTALQRCSRALAAKELFQVRIGVLKDLIEHHVEEERYEIFPRAKEALGADELEELGAEMEKRFAVAQKASSPAAKLDRMSTARAREALGA